MLLLAAGCNDNEWHLVFGPSNSSEIRAVWDGSGPNADDYVNLDANRLSNQSGCTTVWFDWEKDPGTVHHYDPRAARDCDPNPGSDPEDDFARHLWDVDYDVVRMRKAAACPNNIDPPNPTTCEVNEESDPDSPVEDFAHFSQRACISFIIRFSDDTIDYNPGGKKDDCTR